jgi:hypothetical protein
MSKVTRPELYIWTSDITGDFKPAFLAGIGVNEVTTRCLFDNSRHVYIASLQPSIWLEYIDFEFDMVGVDDMSQSEFDAKYATAFEALHPISADNESGYVDAPRNMAAFESVRVSDDEYEDLREMVEADPEDGYNDWITKQAEYLRANGV